ncbi:MAG TPA: 2-oxoglutarate dehydrogenase complex dihydrolipoyllysine-residue succinyltransferase [Tenuifilaceae bacterium]|nr:2-oxoglutarate dehydrogenase complex dihydrolipoyllysine-residue succinyltransferase [Tenuifilaceae bacterium]HPE18608.1 2-oxoglutarate dehydrogenase complex dihydrolipoyllysine-residue succinyltransferase [Tenuifilaceae bacterium]HPJ46021.1 2-oxoglutarate dehydrogenase complex dihydrolipoyllysine-residue succinyltransferase [Tenuifilaceae bacterium]HPQ34724.1 2-oxoglutarate dehydrogenase complex dihydrolipoyllysine-residue succinyltransferase [Tenuifilaceae bacterium]HRX67353.1 2-oxoglutara
MQVEIKIPSPGESITEVEIARWLVDDNSWVEKDQEVAEIESEKATLPLLASHSGVVSIKANEGTIKVGETACTIDTEAKKEAKSVDKESKIEAKEKIEEKVVEKPAEKIPIKVENHKVKVTPLARKLMDEKGLNVDDIINGLKKISTEEVNLAVSGLSVQNVEKKSTERIDERTTMSQLRKKLSQRLVSVKNETAMLTTFNEVDMSRVMEIRRQYQKDFQEKHGIKLGFMSFFTKSVIEALKQHPMVNSRIEGDEIVTPNYFDIGIAVQTPKGLMVPVLRSAQDLSIPQIEAEVARLAEKGRSGRIGLDDLEGGTFTITNGGVFGSMMSTPILNPPQSGILGMHNIVDRPVAVNGKVEIRPMMYIALSYDHRIIDGKDSVGFLVKVKQMIENPQQMLVGGVNPERLLLGI